MNERCPMSLPVAVRVAAEPVCTMPAPPADRALITDEEWQALLWPASPVPVAALASEALKGETS